MGRNAMTLSSWPLGKSRFARFITTVILTAPVHKTIVAAFIVTSNKPSYKTKWMSSPKPNPSMVCKRIDHRFSFCDNRREILVTKCALQEKTPCHQKMTSNARGIISLIQDRYSDDMTEVYEGATSAANSDETSTNGRMNKKVSPWAKMRRYIYGATSSSTSTSKRYQPLTEGQVLSVLTFLEETFHDGCRLNLDVNNNSTTTLGQNVDIIRLILQTKPRILRKNVESYLVPTVEFLKGLYPGPMFYQAIQRNPNLLLTSGVGYNDNIILARNSNDQNKGTDSNRKTGTHGKYSIEYSDVASYLQNETLGLSSNHIKRLKKSHPSIFQLSVEHKIKPTINSLLSLFLSTGEEEEESLDYAKKLEEERLGRSGVVGKMIVANPNILHLSLHSNLIPKVEFLQNLGFESYEDMTLLWRKCPGILGLSKEENLKPKIIFLTRLLSTTREDVWCGRSAPPTTLSDTTEVVGSAILKKCLRSHPQLLLLSMDNLMSKVSYFHSIHLPLRKAELSNNATSAIAELNDKDDNILVENMDNGSPSLAARILIQAPSVYSLSLKNNIIPTMECISRLCGDRSTGAFLAEFPTILTLSLEGNIVPTLQFFNRTGYIALDEEGRRKSNSSYVSARYIASSLFNRLLPRWSYFIALKGGGEEVDTRVNSIPWIIDKSLDVITDDVKAPPLHLLAGASDKEFCRRMGFSIISYDAFKHEMSPALKFNAQFIMWLKTGRPIDEQ